MNQLQQAQHGYIQQAEHTLRKLENEKGKLVEVIKAGIPTETLKEEFDRNTKQREHMLGVIKQSEIPTVQTVKPDMTARYQDAIRTLRETVANSDSENRDEGIDLIRNLIDKVVMTPNPQADKLDVCLYGDLAKLLVQEGL